MNVKLIYAAIFAFYGLLAVILVLMFLHDCREAKKKKRGE